MSQRQPVRFGLVGAGAIAHAYGQAFATTAAAELVGVADARAEAADAFGEQYGCAAFRDHAAMLDAVAPEAVIVATPPSTHEELVVDLLRRGVAVLCEKPLAPTPAAARRMIAAAREADVPLSMASKFRYVADMIAAKSLLASGVLGEVLRCDNVFTGRVDMSGRWNGDPAIGGGGVLIDNGTHSVDVMRYLLGPLVRVQVVEGGRAEGMRVEDTVHAFVEAASGARGQIELSWRIHKPLPWFVTVFGTLGMLEVGWQQSRYKLYSAGEWVVFGKGYDKVGAFARQLDNVAGAIRHEEPMLIDADDALASVETIAAAYRSMTAATWQEVLAPVGAP